jgi:CheY-like chemotaxis protein
MPLILVVDDYPDNRDLLTQMLRLHGYHVLTATNGHEAVLVTQATFPSLVLMDLAMPVMDGWTATAAIKQTPLLATIPIVAVTGNGAAEDRARAVRAGCSDYLEKPIDYDRLMALVTRLAPAGRGDSASPPHA